MFCRTVTTRIIRHGIKTANYVTQPEAPANPLVTVYKGANQKTNGLVYDNKPVKVTLEAGKKYNWCACGRSKKQPFCNGSHMNFFLRIAERPIKFSVSETKEYWLCNCKQSKNKPFCDGTHKQKEIQEATTRV